MSNRVMLSADTVGDMAIDAYQKKVDTAEVNRVAKATAVGTFAERLASRAKKGPLSRAEVRRRASPSTRRRISCDRP